jgi:hypothetical protein
MQKILHRRKGSQRILRHDKKSSPQRMQTKQKSQKGLRTHESVRQHPVGKRRLPEQTTADKQEDQEDDRAGGAHQSEHQMPIRCLALSVIH